MARDRHRNDPFGEDDRRERRRRRVRRAGPSPAPIKKLRQCTECDEFFSERTTMYEAIVTLRAEVPEVVEIDTDDPALEDPQSAMEQILADMEKMDPEELADQVHESYTFLLCPACRGRMHRALKEKATALRDEDEKENVETESNGEEPEDDGDDWYRSGPPPIEPGDLFRFEFGDDAEPE